MLRLRTSEEHVEIPSLYYFVLFGTFKTESHEIVTCGSIQKFMISYCVTIYLSSSVCVCACVRACVCVCVTIIWQVHQVHRPLEKGIFGSPCTEDPVNATTSNRKCDVIIT